MVISTHVAGNAALNTSEDIDTMTPYRVITLLLDGALDRVEQAMQTISLGDMDAAAILVQKTIGIIGGLRESLDFNKGGEIADNLEVLYQYITERLVSISNDSPLETLEEVKSLLQEVHDGWSGIGDAVND